MFWREKILLRGSSGEGVKSPNAQNGVLPAQMANVARGAETVYDQNAAGIAYPRVSGLIIST
jgi:hypothetical protein